MGNLVEMVSFIVCLTIETSKFMDKIVSESESILVVRSVSLCGRFFVYKELSSDLKYFFLFVFEEISMFLRLPGF